MATKARRVYVSIPMVLGGLLSASVHARDFDAGLQGASDRIFASGFETLPCVGLECFQVACPGSPTSVRGTVFAPNGTLPLPNVTVYVPNDDVQPLPARSQCARCDIPPSGAPLVSTTTLANGNFVLNNVPATNNVPLVIQIGKWRRLVTIPTVTACAQTQVNTESTRLPRNQSEGDLPLIALTTGAAATLECTLRRIGVDDIEFTPGGGSGRVHLYAGHGGVDSIDAANGGESLPSAITLWGASATLDLYDLVLNSCEGTQYANEKPIDAREALKDYADLGGRLLLMHWHNVWIESGPTAWQPIANWSFLPGLGNVEVEIATGFARGDELAAWVVPATASGTPGKIMLSNTRHTVTGVDTAKARRRVYKDVTANNQPTVQYFSFTTPVENALDERCGRVAFSDVDTIGPDSAGPGFPFPGGCNSMVSAMTPEEKLTAYAIFDLGACVGNAVE